MYLVKEMFYSLQGEGAQAGRPSVFCRFSGCNLWNGKESGRANAQCSFCDTDFVGTDGNNGGKFRHAAEVADAVAALWPAGNPGKPYVVCTGGEPLMQLDDALIAAFHERGFEVAVETNGTLEAPAGIDWLCVSPKAGCELKQRSGHELKLIYPQAENDPQDFANMDFDNFYLQAKDETVLGGVANQNLQATLQYCLTHPQWRLSMQMHKIVGIE
ncbi:7-carboxy-7-deazaguanine synthase [Aliagarivorans marinus]|uniref:7-carboxy-7-deazaguanine synthase n=1 Tax=Aliagarivorans marinus TaxID=561965 RepID=UPI000405B004|nr:7-carboxy-7-deazaguanine synthase [Aliagarivorans marinus]